MRSTLALAGAAFTCALALFTPRASACGGFFCSSSPIDQAGETIVYGIEADGTLTMAVQIRYSGDDDDFAWILPVPAVPEITTGTDRLFTELRRATEPAFIRHYRTSGRCRVPPRCVEPDDCGPTYETSGCGFDESYDPPDDPDPRWSGGHVDASARVDAAAPPVADGGVTDGGAVTVLSRGDVGPYEIVVLGALNAREMLEWLHEHGYDIPDASEPLLESYAASGQSFVAVRLSSDADTRMIQPLVLRMPTDEACLPIRLTAIATVPDLPITTFFLGDARAAPVNYSLIEDAADERSLWTAGRSWTEHVSRRVDEMDGRAFVTEYAGPTPALSLRLSSVEGMEHISDPASYLRELLARGYAGTAELLRLVRRHLEPPPGEPAAAYANCLMRQSVERCGAPTSFDPVGLTEAIDAEITQASAEAEALVRRHGYLTRLFTTMSAADMTVDPVFHLDSGLSDVPSVRVMTQVRECDRDHFREGAPLYDVLPSGERVLVSAGQPAPTDEAYCATRGRIPSDAPRSCAEEEPPPRSSGCGFCTVAGMAPVQGGALGGLLFMWLARRFRRVSRRR